MAPSHHHHPHNRDGSGGWNDVDVQYYRYYTSDDMLLKYVVGAEAYRRLTTDDDFTTL